MSRNLRKYIRQTNFRLIGGGLIILFIVGEGLIYLIYGPSAAALGLLCLFASMIPIAMVIIIMLILERIAKRANRD